MDLLHTLATLNLRAISATKPCSAVFTHPSSQRHVISHGAVYHSWTPPSFFKKKTPLATPPHQEPHSSGFPETQAGSGCPPGRNGSGERLLDANLDNLDALPFVSSLHTEFYGLVSIRSHHPPPLRILLSRWCSRSSADPEQ